jgi:tRNA-specific 2-thiouridylase
MERIADDAGIERGSLVVTLTDPLRGVSPGQTVVLYQGSRVLGQATIDAARSLQRAQL